MAEENRSKKGRKKGLIIVNTGNGKGKTSAALGTSLRAAGNGFKVLVLQFMKGSWKYGELEAFKKFSNVEIVQLGSGFTWHKENLDEDRALAEKGWQKAKDAILNGDYQLIVLDEINYVLSYGLLDIGDIIKVLEKKPKMLHVILTGRDAMPEIIKFADLVTEMKEIKHPFKDGIYAQKGIEF